MPFIPEWNATAAGAGAGARVTPHRRLTVTSEVLYPMYVMPITSFLERYGPGQRRLEPHQKLKKLGLVVEYQKAWDNQIGELLFISHEWAGFEHCDPTG